MRLTAEITCPSCGCTFTGRWTEGRETAAQRCGSCGHVFDATWPGFTFEPQTVIISPSAEEPGHGAA